ncbi:hypothetical protein CFC21_073504 [Triticum aestivum]|uniref:Uncharacterized protein n=2 Tax=Triticum aestivum TaxID=4565 RepID=A0A3B6LT47_WHEAT|nr:hypothetical protein CFC21_073504 [Triticum aestivum]
MEVVEPAVVVSCECCGPEEECTGEYIGGVRAYFGGWWLCGLCSKSIKYDAGRSKRIESMGVEEAVRADMAFCRIFRRGGPAERVAEGICQMLRRTACEKQLATSSSSSRQTAPATVASESGHHRTSVPSA